MAENLTCRLPAHEAELFREYADHRGVFVSHAIRELVNREIHETLKDGASRRSAVAA